MSHLNSKQTHDLEQQLRAQAATLRAEIRDELLRSDDEHFIDLAGRVHDLAEEAVADLLADTSIAIIDRQIGELREVESALRRISSGGFGLCVDCGEPIEERRLQAMPSASRCIRCQERAENTGRGIAYTKL